MTAPGGAGGFRIARAFVEIVGRIDRDSVRRDVDAAARSYSDAGGGAGDHFSKGFTSKTSERMRGTDGKFIGDGLKTSLSGGIKGALDSVPTEVKAGLGIGIVAVAGPLLGAGIAGAIAGGLGAGGVVGGVMIATRDPAVRASITKLGQDAGDILARAATPFKGATLEAVETIRGRLFTLEPTLRSIFGKSAGYLAPLLDGVMDGVETFMTFVDSSIGNVGPAVDGLADAFRILGAGAGIALQIISEESENGGSALKDLAMIASTTLVGIAHLISFLSDRYRNLRDAAEWLGLVDEEQQKVLTSAEGAAAGARVLNSAMGNVSSTSNSYQQRQAILNSTIEAGTEVAGSYAQMLDILNGAAMSAEEATLAYRSAVAKATAAIKENGKGLDNNTDSGRANRRALLDVAKAAGQDAAAAYEKVYRETGNVSKAQDAASAKLRTGRAEFIRIAEGMGMSRAEANRYADQLYKIPASRNTQVNANTGAANSNINGVRSNLGRLDGDSATVTIWTKHVVTGMKAGADYLNSQAGKAVGGPVQPGAYLVGEQGPELFFPNTRGDIATATQTRNLLNGATAGKGGSGGGDHYHFAPGSITLDASRIRSIEDLMGLIAGIKSTARTYRARTATAPGV